MPTTYTPISSSKINNNSTNTVTFSSIPSTYTDLVISITGQTTTTSQDMRLRFNGDSGNNYSFTMEAAGNGSAYSYQTSNQNAHWLDYDGTGTVNWVIAGWRCDIMNYSNTTTNKTLLAHFSCNGVNFSVALWRNTAAINSIAIFPGASNFTKGSIVSLYGIKAA